MPNGAKPLLSVELQRAVRVLASRLSCLSLRVLYHASFDQQTINSRIEIPLPPHLITRGDDRNMCRAIAGTAPSLLKTLLGFDRVLKTSIRTIQFNNSLKKSLVVVVVVVRSCSMRFVQTPPGSRVSRQQSMFQPRRLATSVSECKV